MRRLLCLLLLPVALLADERRYDFREKVLPNGLRVVTLEDFSSPIVAVQVWYHVGSKNERADRQGFAHMFEHMMFRGTERVGPKDFDRLTTRAGGTNNAFTSFDNTTYVNELPSNQLDLILWLEVERMLFLKVDALGFFTERKVVEEERRENYLNPPYGLAPEQALGKIFLKHPYRWMPIGKIPDLRAATIEELEAFWSTFYVPNNAVLVIAGAVKHEEAQRAAERWFGWVPKCPDPPRVAELEPPQTAPREITIQEKKGPVPVVALAFRTVPVAHPDAPALDLLIAILGDGESSRLNQDLVKERQVAQTAMASHFTLEQDGLAVLGAVLGPLGDKKKAMDALLEHVKRVREAPVGQEELEKVKNNALVGVVTETLTVEGKASALGEAALIRGDADYVNVALERIRAVTVEDIQRVANTYLADERKTSVTIEPSIGGFLKGMLGGSGGDENEGAPPVEEPKENRVAARSGFKGKIERPEGFPATAPLAPLLETPPGFSHEAATLENGVKVVVIEDHEVPYVSVSLRLDKGQWAEQKPGAANLSLGMLTKGTKAHDAASLARELDFHAISLGGGVGADSATVGTSCLAEKLPLAMGYLAEVVFTPTFPESELAILKQQTVTDLMVDENDPSTLAGREFSRQLYGAHPYARRITGEIADVQAITRADVQAFWTPRPESATLIFAGDVTLEGAKALAAKHFGGWKVEGKSASEALPPFPEPGKFKIVVVDAPGAAQSEIRVGHLAMGRGSADWHKGTVLSQILGGGFLSRLNDKLRVELGLTYGASGGFSASRFGGIFRASTSTKTETTAEAVRAILDVLETLRAGPPTADEMDLARSDLVGSFAGRYETPQSRANAIWLLLEQGLPEDYYQKAYDGYRTATAADVLAVAKEHVHPDKVVVVVAGDAKRIKESLEKIGPVEVVKGK
ncbi:MAG TPA: pitrilysin family protein [Planctomycetota bacterium]|nr:pitrilysin family protein [Planctomycetota bacterium]